MKKFTLIQLFALVDGRLSTPMSDIYDMLNYICDQDGALMTHHLPVALDYIKLKNPPWFKEVKTKIESLGITKDMEWPKVKTILDQSNRTYEIPRLKDGYDTSDFGNYMVDNSLLLKIGSKA